MRRCVLLMAFWMGCYFQSKAQIFNIGLEAGMNLSNMATAVNNIKTNGEFLPGIRGGGIVDINFGKVSLQPGLVYSGKGYKLNEIRMETVNGVLISEKVAATIRVHYLEVPFNVQYNFSPIGNGRFFAGGGAYTAFAVGGNVASDRSGSLVNDMGSSMGIKDGNNRELSFGNDSLSNDVKRVDVGLNINAGYKFDMGLFFRSAVGFGLANLKPQGTEKNSLRNFNLAFTIGYMFR